MKMERQEPACVIGIGKLTELQGIRQDIAKLTIGVVDDHPRSCAVYYRARKGTPLR